jgi:NADH dehydrogenase
VVLGGGFGGLAVTRKLAGLEGVEVTLVDRTNHHLFQPLLYQVASSLLSPANIAEPFRKLVGKMPNTHVVFGEVCAIDRDARTLDYRAHGTPPDARPSVLPFDYLVVAVGATHSYFGHPEWEEFAPGLKSLEDAVRIRNRMLAAIEQGEVLEDLTEAERYARTTLVVVGGGATGVELCGSFAELMHFEMQKEFKRLDPGALRVLLVEAEPEILPSHPPRARAAARARLERLGVEVRTNTRVVALDSGSVTFASGERIAADNKVWAAGVQANPLLKTLGVPLDSAGRAHVRADCTIPNDGRIFVIGDCAHFDLRGSPLPGVATVALQQGRYVGSLLRRELSRPGGGGPSVEGRRTPFRYVDKGMMAVVGKNFAVASTAGVELRGFIAWIAWLAVHIYYLVGMNNRIGTMLAWGWTYLRGDRGARIIVDYARAARSGVGGTSVAPKEPAPPAGVSGALSAQSAVAEPVH